MKYVTLLFLILIQVFALQGQNRLEIDQTFGQNGYVELAPGNWEGIGLLEQPDGKLIAFGEKISINGSYFRDVRLARMHPDGSLDLSFNGTGVVTTDLEYESFYPRMKAVLQPDGKILVASRGALSAGSLEQGILIRYMADGSLDTSFANGGQWIFSLNDLGTTISDVSILADGTIRLVLSLSDLNAWVPDLVIAKLNTNGALDLSFGQNGYAAIPSDLLLGIEDAIFDPNGNLYLLGRDNEQPGMFMSRLLKLNASGGLEWNLPLSVIATQVTQLDEPYFYHLEFDHQGRLLVGGNQFGSRPVFLKLNPDGNLDPTFGESGAVAEAFGNDFGSAGQFVIQTDGKILNMAGPYFTALRLNDDGSSDLTFNGNGLIDAFPPNGEWGNNRDRSFGVYQQSNGKILMCGTVAGKLQIARFESTSCSN